MTADGPDSERVRPAASYPGQRRQDQRPLDHGKARAGTGARAGRKGNIGLARAGLAVLGFPAARIKDVGVVPQPLMAVQMPSSNVL